MSDLKPLTLMHKVAGIFNDEIFDVVLRMTQHLPRDVKQLRLLIAEVDSYQKNTGIIIDFQMVRDAAESLLADLEDEDVEY